MTKTDNKKSAKQKKVLVASIILAGMIVAGGTFAWFTSKDQVTNKLTATNNYGVSITEDFTPTDNWTPGQEVNKDVYGVNTGNVPAFVKVGLANAFTIYTDTTSTQEPSDNASENGNYVEITPDEAEALESGGRLVLWSGLRTYYATTDANIQKAETGSTDKDKKTIADDSLYSKYTKVTKQEFTYTTPEGITINAVQNSTTSNKVYYYITGAIDDDTLTTAKNAEVTYYDGDATYDAYKEMVQAINNEAIIDDYSWNSEAHNYNDGHTECKNTEYTTSSGLTITFGSEKKVDASDSTNTTVVHYVTVKQDNKDWEAADKLYNGKNGTTYAHAEFLFQRTDGTVVGYYLVRDNGDLHYYKLAGIQLWEEGTDGDKAYQLTFQTKTKVENPTIKFAHASNASADYVVAGTSGYVYINKDDPSNPHYYLIAQADYSIGEGDNEVKYSIPIRVYLDDGWSKNWTFTVGTDGNPVFYYEKVLGAGETTTRLVDKLVLSEKVDTSVYNSFEYDLTVTLDSIQVVIDENGTYLPTAVNSDKTWTYSATVSADDNSTVTWAKKS